MEYLVTPAPHRRQKISTNDMFIYVFIALVMCYLYGFINYGWSALIVLVTCFCPVVVLELIISCIKNKKFVLSDFSCFVTGMTLACVMPINMPWYLGILAAVISVAFKYLFGGLGNNLFNSSALGRSVVGCLFSGFSMSFFESPTVLQMVLADDKSLINMQDVVLGNAGGAVGTSCILMIAIAAIILMVMGIIRWENILFSLIGFVSIVWALWGFDYVFQMMFSGSFLFATVFMLSDPTTSPYGFSARSIYALLFGILSAIFLKNNIMGETAVFLVLLICNFVSPMLDSIFSIFKKGVRSNG